MYIPHAFREDDLAKLVAFMQANSFVTLVSILDGMPFASHIPLVVEHCDGAVTVTGHLARANPHWQAFGHGETLAIFTGPHAYISPSLYEKRESVPTWNYIAVHAYGVPQIIPPAESGDAVAALLDTMIDFYEAAYADQWQTLPDKFRDGMMQGIVAFTMPVTRLEGKYKLSQNRSRADQQTVAHHLLQSADPSVRGVGEAMAERLGNTL